VENQLSTCLPLTSPLHDGLPQGWPLLVILAPSTPPARRVAETSVNPSAPSRQALERWAERQSPTPQGTVRPVMVVLEPLAAEPPSPAAEPAP
jgi:hypothetical protein